MQYNYYCRLYIYYIVSSYNVFESVIKNCFRPQI